MSAVVEEVLIISTLLLVTSYSRRETVLRNGRGIWSIGTAYGAAFSNDLLKKLALNANTNTEDDILRCVDSNLLDIRFKTTGD